MGCIICDTFGYENDERVDKAGFIGEIAWDIVWDHTEIAEKVIEYYNLRKSCDGKSQEEQERIIKEFRKKEDIKYQ